MGRTVIFSCKSMHFVYGISTSAKPEGLGWALMLGSDW